jgi:hypothetical protein
MKFGFKYELLKGKKSKSFEGISSKIVVRTDTKDAGNSH